MDRKRYKIILVEDDTSLGYLLSEYLGMKDFEIRWIQSADTVLPLLEQEAFDLLILDVMMPGMDGFTLGERIREQHPDLPFIFLTARSMKIDVLKGFSVGAVDYLKKPIDEEELVVRIETLLTRLERSTEPQQSREYQMGSYSFDPRNQSLQVESEVFPLTKRENELLEYLVRQANRLCRHEDILKRIWGRNDYFNRKSLNVFITRLRKHLSRDPRLKIENIHGQGFILHLPPDQKA